MENFGHKHTQVTNIREFFRQKRTLFVPCAKKTNFCSENILFGSQFLSEICHFCTEQKICYFLSNFFTSVRYLRMFVSNFFRFFQSIFIFFKFRKQNRVHVHPGIKVDFRNMRNFLHMWKYISETLIFSCLCCVFVFSLTPVHAM